MNFSRILSACDEILCELRNFYLMRFASGMIPMQFLINVRAATYEITENDRIGQQKINSYEYPLVCYFINMQTGLNSHAWGSFDAHAWGRAPRRPVFIFPF